MATASAPGRVLRCYSPAGMRRFLPVFWSLAPRFVDLLRRSAHPARRRASTRASASTSGRPARRVPGARRPRPGGHARTILATIRTIIENRINQYGVAEPVVQTQGTDRIVVEIPGVRTCEEIRELIGQPAGSISSRSRPTGQRRSSQGCRCRHRSRGVIFSGDQISAAARHRLRPASGRSTLDAQGPGAQTRSTTSQARYRGATTYQAAVRHRPRRHVLSAPSINATPLRRPGRRSRAASRPRTSTTWSPCCKYGSLPLAIEEVSFSQISATLGLNFLQQTLLAGAIGIALVFIFMLIHYRLPGVDRVRRADLLHAGRLRDLPAHPGDADAGRHCRLRALGGHGGGRQHPDLRANQGRAALRQDRSSPAIEAGFNRAWNSIFDSNMSSIITAAILSTSDRHHPRLRARADHRRADCRCSPPSR